jgi:uncharacterized Ntn-hydrolase superfamily protein
VAALATALEAAEKAGGDRAQSSRRALCQAARGGDGGSDRAVDLVRG